MKQLLFLLLAFATSSAFGQSEQLVVTGTVIDSATGQPLAGASVFCQNTTFGTISKSDGAFALYLPAGGYDLVISYTSYETRILRIHGPAAATLSIVLKPKDKSLEEVAVTGSAMVADGYSKYGQFFFDHFVGTSPNALQCSIQNPEVLQFYFYKKRNRLKVKATDDLVIVNNALGYKIKFQLDTFAYEYSTDISTYTGFPFFEELPANDSLKAVWKENRENAYAGSRLHFVRSWYDSTLADEGFVIERVDSASKTLKTYPIDDPYDSSMYRVVENNDVEINYNGRMRIIFKNAQPDPQYLRSNHLPNTLHSQISIIDIDDGFIIQQNGYFYDQNDVTNAGYWSWQKLGDVLPYDYNP
ncbi:MAG TPA: carboxypeptidase-like regulatory domain-containing protein [Chitinophagaceae bacterium]|jgi:hypothetical protein